jgi:transcriptional regulator with XRE-family HTH domain
VLSDTDVVRCCLTKVRAYLIAVKGAVLASAFGAQLATWTRLALDAAKRQGINQGDVARKAGISGDTLYAYLRGAGENAKEENILALAAAAGVAAPVIERTLRFSGATVGGPPIIGLLREAVASVEAATKILEDEEKKRLGREAADIAVSALTAGKGTKGARRRKGGAG